MLHHREMPSASLETATPTDGIQAHAPNVARAVLPVLTFLGVAAVLLAFPQWVTAGDPSAALGRHPVLGNPPAPGATISWWRSFLSIEALVGAGFVRWMWWLLGAEHRQPGPGKARLLPGLPLWLPRGQASAHWTVLLVLGFIAASTEGILYVARWLLR